LTCLADLGKWWEAETSMPIPLGGIAIRRDIPKEIAFQIETAIRESLRYANKHPHTANEYIKTHAQEIDDNVIGRHIGLYVNEFSMDLGAQGVAAIETLFIKARSKKIIQASEKDIFLRPGA
jgi:1,4-dihydroxy-6-naphthoate synthase